jgi:hypothetical protein
MIAFDININQPVAPISLRPTGISFETGDIGVFPNPVLEQLLKNVSGTFRIGGSSTDITCLPTDWSGPYCKIAMTQSRVDAVVGAATRINYPLSIGVNFLRPNSIVQQAKFLFDAGVKNIEVGNEPDLYGSSGIRPVGYSIANYTDEYIPIAAAIRAAIPGIKITGPAVCCRFDAGSIKDFGITQDVQEISVHPYATEWCDKTKPAPTAEFLLSEDRMKSFRARGYAALAAGIKPKKLRLNETNSTACGGSPGVSNSMAAALWGVDWGFEALQMGADGLNFHNAGTLYNPILVDKVAGTATPNPLYYALLMLDRAKGQTLVSTAKTGTENVKVWATKHSNGQLNVYVINKDMTFSGNIALNIPGKTGNAKVFTMGGAGINATSGIKFGTQSVSSTGTFNLVNDATAVPNGSQYMVTVRNGGAVMLAIP